MFADKGFGRVRFGVGEKARFVLQGETRLVVQTVVVRLGLSLSVPRALVDQPKDFLRGQHL